MLITRELPKFKKRYTPGAQSDRLLLPGDGSPTKVTRFRAETEESFSGMSYDCDETVIAISGTVTITTAGKSFVLNAGQAWCMKAGTEFSLHVNRSCDLVCVYSRAEGGDPVPDEEMDETCETGLVFVEVTLSSTRADKSGPVVLYFVGNTVQAVLDDANHTWPDQIQGHRQVSEWVVRDLGAKHVDVAIAAMSAGSDPIGSYQLQMPE